MKRKGFTLIELVLTISIIVILSVISGPIYNSYVYKVEQAEGYALLGTIRSAQERYYSEWGIFLYCSHSSSGVKVYTCNEEVLGIDARPNKYYTYFSVGREAENGSLSDFKYHYTADAYGNNGNTLIMRYNITSGVRIEDKW